jgi:hypothetical protein
MLRRFCEKHFEKLADPRPVRDAGERIVVLAPDPGEQCEFCKEPATRLAPLQKEGE